LETNPSNANWVGKDSCLDSLLLEKMNLHPSLTLDQASKVIGSPWPKGWWGSPFSDLYVFGINPGTGEDINRYPASVQAKCEVLIEPDRYFGPLADLLRCAFRVDLQTLVEGCFIGNIVSEKNTSNSSQLSQSDLETGAALAASTIAAFKPRVLIVLARKSPPLSRLLEAKLLNLEYICESRGRKVTLAGKSQKRYVTESRVLRKGEHKLMLIETLQHPSRLNTVKEEAIAHLSSEVSELIPFFG
jgi:hypothetical protein